MDLQRIQKILCDYGYENIDILIRESLEKSFNLEGYKFGVIHLFEGYISLNKINIHSYREDEMAMFVYSPKSKVVTLENMGDYLLTNIIVKNLDIDKLLQKEDELFKRRSREDLKSMINEYIIGTDHIKYEIIDYIGVCISI